MKEIINIDDFIHQQGWLIILNEKLKAQININISKIKKTYIKDIDYLYMYETELLIQKNNKIENKIKINQNRVIEYYDNKFGLTNNTPKK